MFAPTDEAVLKLPPGTLEDLLKPEDKNKSRNIVTYHVSGPKTLEGGSVKITAGDSGVMVNEAHVAG